MYHSTAPQFKAPLVVMSALCLYACNAADDSGTKTGGSESSGNTRAETGGQAAGTVGGSSVLGSSGGTGALQTPGKGTGGSSDSSALVQLPQAGSVSGLSSANTAGGSSSPLPGIGGSSSATTALQGLAGALATGGSNGQGGNASTEVLPPELVGVWQETRASSGDYVSASGATFSLTSGLSVQLKLSSNGAYYLANLGSGVAQTCGSVSNFEQSVGYATLVGDSLVFTPTQHLLEVNDCDGQRMLDLGNAPFSLAISLEEAQHLYGGLRTYRMQATGGPHPYDLKLLHRPPVGNPPVQDQPADFTLGTDGPYQDFQGLWVAAAGTDADFFNPNTGDYYLPQLNGSTHAWLRMTPEGYETAIALQNVNSDGPCKSDVIYYEQGTARFAVLEDVGGQGSHFVGHARLDSTAARMIVRIRECDEHNGDIAYDLPGVPRYFRFIYFSPANPPESITFGCDFPLNEWQAILCEAFPKGFNRRQ